MKFLSGVYRATDPNVMVQVIVSFDKILYQEGDNPRCDLRVIVTVDRNGDGVADATEQIRDIPRVFTATPSQFDIVFNRMRGSGNLMALLRQFCKNQIDAHNSDINPGGPSATHTDLDDDQPIVV